MIIVQSHFFHHRNISYGPKRAFQYSEVYLGSSSQQAINALDYFKFTSEYRGA